MFQDWNCHNIFIKWRAASSNWAFLSCLNSKCLLVLKHIENTHFNHMLTMHLPCVCTKKQTGPARYLWFYFYLLYFTYYIYILYNPCSFGYIHTLWSLEGENLAASEGTEILTTRVHGIAMGSCCDPDNLTSVPSSSFPSSRETLSQSWKRWRGFPSPDQQG